jgi:hypothetical protein
LKKSAGAETAFLAGGSARLKRPMRHKGRFRRFLRRFLALDRLAGVAVLGSCGDPHLSKRRARCGTPIDNPIDWVVCKKMREKREKREKSLLACRRADDRPRLPESGGDHWRVLFKVVKSAQSRGRTGRTLLTRGLLLSAGALRKGFIRDFDVRLPFAASHPFNKLMLRGGWRQMHG